MKVLKRFYKDMSQTDLPPSGLIGPFKLFGKKNNKIKYRNGNKTLYYIHVADVGQPVSSR